MIKSAAALLGALLLLGCAKELPKDSLVLVSGEPITRAQLDAERRLQGDAAAQPAALLEDLIDQALMLQEAKRRGLELQPGELENQLALARAGTPEAEFEAALKSRGIAYTAWKERIRRRALCDELVRRQLRQGISVKPQDLKDYYWEHVTQFRRSESVHLFQVFSRSWRSVLKAQSELSLGEPFAEVAKRHSEGPEAAEGGDMGWVARHSLPAKLDQAAFALKKGKLSQVLRSAYGYHLLLAQEFRPESNRSLEEAAPEIMEALLREKEQPLYRDWLAGLRMHAEIRRLKEAS